MQIQVNGGLGNQLFQYSYAHYARSKSGHRKVRIAVEPKLYEGDRFFLEDLISKCNHIYSSNVYEEPIILKVLKKMESLISIPFGVKWLSRILIRTHPDYVFELEINKEYGIHQGYFQNWKYVEEVWHQVGTEINQKLSGISLEAKFELETNYTVAHVRRGDYLNLQNLYGTLGANHYKEALKAVAQDLKQNLYIISDDDQIGRALANQLGGIRAFGPHDLQEWEALKLMSMARCVIAANSTFSWWGSYLCHKSGGLAILPAEYFVTNNISANTALQYPGARISKSIYE